MDPIKLNPRDTLVVTINSDTMTADQTKAMEEKLKGRFPYNDVMLFVVGLEERVSFHVMNLVGKKEE